MLGIQVRGGRNIFFDIRKLWCFQDKRPTKVRERNGDSRPQSVLMNGVVSNFGRALVKGSVALKH